MTTDRNPETVINQIIDALGGYANWPIACDALEKLKVTHSFRAPELSGLTWDALQEIIADIIGEVEPALWNDAQKNAVRIFTGNPNVV